jgi:hypothetical protein
MNVTINTDLSSHIVNDDSTLECFLPNYNPVTQVPFGSQAEVQAFISTSLTPNYFVPFKSADQRTADANAAKAATNAARAKQDLVDTDWCENASVRNTSVTPHLTNGAEFDAYRLQLRAIIVNNTVDVTTWPTQPVGVWSK